MTHAVSITISRLKKCAGYMSRAVIYLSIVVGLAACSDADTPDIHDATLYDVVELTAQNGSGSVFTLWRPDATVPVTLTTSTPVINTSVVEVGDCLFLAYRPVDGRAYTSGPVEVSAYGTVNNAPLMKSTSQNLEGWDTEPVCLMSLWRAGDKVCMRLRMTYDTAPRLFALVIDESTAKEEYPTAYLYHRRPSDVPNFSRQYYAAFDLSSLWATPGCKGVCIRVSNSNNPNLDTFVIDNRTTVEPVAE